MIKKIFYTFLILSVLVCFGAVGTLYWFVAVEPGEEISETYIRSILGRESPVFYSDGISPLGVFFADAHRQYIDYDAIPKLFIDALVAAEDNRFFSHFGFDVVGITRAAIKNIQARRIVQGGSTLTQQTAKNLFKRKNRSVQAKLKELLYALRLEYHYSKEHILEFYINQFYVSGNGLGLGVAARYYFDKKPGELSLVESAYIAGSVKRPNYYNPFIKRTSNAIQQAKERGKVRAGYVLKKMHELEMIGQAAYQEALATEINFKKGAVGYSLDYVMEMVTDAVASERVIEALAVHGIDNIATSGIRIITTVDKGIQSRTLYALRKQLSYLDVRLRGYERAEVQAELKQIDYGGDRELEVRAFLFGVIRSIRQDGDQPAIEIYFGRKNGTGIIDKDGLTGIIEARSKWRKHRWSESTKEDYQELLDQLREGDRVWVSVRAMELGKEPLLDLERFPEVKGGAIVVQQGQLAAVAGGVENRFFNRAVYGKRTMGSSFKPFVFAAALQLGWTASDLLNNRRDVFVYQNKPYFPRPDHHIDHELVSMSWAGVRSENIAAVWLLKHLCDNLSRSRLEETASRLGLAPRIVDDEPEPYRLFRTRIRDRYGIVINQDKIRQAAYRKTLQHIESDLIFEGLDAEYEVIKNLHYGLGFKGFLAGIKSDLNVKNTLSDSRKKELNLRMKILTRNFLAFAGLKRQLRAFIKERDDPWASLEFYGEDSEKEKPGLFLNRISGKYIFDLPSLLPDESATVTRRTLQQYLDGLDSKARKDFIDAIMLGGTISVAAYDFINHQVDREFQHMKKLLPYSMEVLEHVEDYRVLVGLHYLIAFGREMGIESKLEPVLSFPLGSNVVTLLETTRMYEGLVTGTATLFLEDSGDLNNTLTVIDRIESEDGLVLYRPESEERKVMSAETSLEIGHILENVVKFGTGKYADKHVKLTGTNLEDQSLDALGISIPLLGKTGTANRYTNASFFGYLPALNSEGNGMVVDGGYAVGVYVGYDDNKMMRRRTTRITGAAGALPAWTDIVNGILLEKEYAVGIDPVDLSFYGLVLNRDELGQVNLGVDKDLGGIIVQPPLKVDPLDRYHSSIMTFGSTGEDGKFKTTRNYAPFWQHQLMQQQAAVDIIEREL